MAPAGRLRPEMFPGDPYSQVNHSADSLFNPIVRLLFRDSGELKGSGFLFLDRFVVWCPGLQPGEMK